MLFMYSIISENDSEEVGEDVIKSLSEESDGNTGDSNLPGASPEEQNPNDVPYLDLQIRRKYSWSLKMSCEYICEKITVKNLHSTPPNNSDGPHSVTCVGTNASSNNAVEECKICMDAEADTIIIPCGHLAFCYECSSRVATRCGTVCPICRTEMKNWQKVRSKSDKCKACETHPATVVLIPCGDMCLCNLCSTNANTCPICLLFVTSHQKVIC